MGKLRTANNRRNRAIRHTVARTRAAEAVSTTDQQAVDTPKPTKAAS